jgi:hypothetical protein
LKTLRFASVWALLMAFYSSSGHANLLQFLCKTASCGTLPHCAEVLLYDFVDDNKRLNPRGFEKIKTDAEYVQVNYSPAGKKNYLAIEKLNRQTMILHIAVVIFEHSAATRLEFERILGADPIGNLTIRLAEELMPRIGKIEEIEYRCERQDPLWPQ